MPVCEANGRASRTQTHIIRYNCTYRREMESFCRLPVDEFSAEEYRGQANGRLLTITFKWFCNSLFSTSHHHRSVHDSTSEPAQSGGDEREFIISTFFTALQSVILERETFVPPVRFC
ncbi:hypothetical protein Bbelb_324100 [Branchiostoma belcheri]|nr:hypothetical protein Bbelb_324100 [Branchiostoma belcheri]